jgi:hypothetical protein
VSSEEKFWCGWKGRWASPGDECAECPERARGECDPRSELLSAGRYRYVLKLDVDWMPDDPRWLEEWKEARRLVLERMYGLEVLRFYTERTERGFHAWIHVASPRRLGDADVNRLQFVLGDDATRCKINAEKIKAGIGDWNRLFSRVIWRRRSKYYVRCMRCGAVIPILRLPREEKKLNS